MKQRTNLSNFERVQATLHDYRDVALFVKDKQVRYGLTEQSFDPKGWHLPKEYVDSGVIDGNRLTIPVDGEEVIIDFYHYQPAKL